MRAYLLLFAILTNFLFEERHAHAQSLSFDHLTLEEGLSERTVLAVTQDSEGFMWFGTREGLNRYDARKIEIYRNDPRDLKSLSDNFVYSMLSDSRQRLWVGTRTGLNLFQPATGNFQRFYSASANAASLSDNTVTCLLEDRSHNLWLGTRNGLNLLVERDTISFLRFTHQPGDSTSLVDDDIHALFQDEDGIIWIGTSHGFSRLHYKSADDYSFQSFRIPRWKGKYEKNNSVNTFQEDARGNLLVGTERNGLLFFDRGTLEFTDRGIRNAKLNSKAIRSLLKNPAGDFWIGTIGGLFIADQDFSKIESITSIHDNPASLSDNSIRAMFYDRDGSYWIGTYHGGVNIYSPLAKQFHHLTPVRRGHKISIKIASAMTRDADRNFWVGTEGSGLFYLDPSSNIKAHFKHDEANRNSLCHDNIKCLLLVEGKGIWIGTIKGLDFYDFRQKTFIHFKNHPLNKNGLPDDVIYDIIEDGEGNYWIATYFGGLVRLNGKTMRVEEVYTHASDDLHSLSSQAVTCLFIDSGKDLWVGTASGLNKKGADGKFSLLLKTPETKTPNSFGEYILSIFEDRHGQLWVGTRASGLYLIADDGSVLRHLSEKDGLPGNSIYGIQEDSKGFLWISTENGLSRLDCKTFSFKNYDRSDGLLTKEFNFNSHYRDPGGLFYFGGYNGVTYFHPDSIYENKKVPAVAFTGIRLFNKEIKASHNDDILQGHVNNADVLEFSHNQNIFSVEFAVLNHINSKKNEFAYKLSGFEDEWNYMKEPIATYMNLAPGTYTLLVKGSNNDGVWSATRSLMIHILPPPWKTWWAYTLYILIFGLLLYTWARLNNRRIKLEHDLQLEHMEKIKQQEYHQAKLNFFTNIAHEIRTPVTLMTAPIEHLIENHSQNLKVKKELVLVKNNTDRLMRLINQLLDFQKQETGNVRLKVSNGNIVGFINEIADSFQEYADSRKVALNVTTSTHAIALWFDRDELSKVFFNVLVNALKFTPGGGEVNISVTARSRTGKCEEDDRAVEVIIEDNGLGISAGNLANIFHRFYQAENTGIQDAGFGIGLALTKGIIDLHHGSISVESREATAQTSGFTRFTIVLPGGNHHFTSDQIVEVQPGRLETEVIEDCGLHQTSFESRELTDKPLILLVEDNDEIRSYVRDILAAQYIVLEAKNGAQGVVIAVEQLPNLIVSDVMMPTMNGIELVVKLKNDARTNHIPIILLTARGTLNHQVEGFETGADDYLTKPFHIGLLLVKIKNHLAIREKLKEKYSRIVSLQPNHEELEDPDDRFLQRLMKILEENIENAEFNVSKLVMELGMSRPVLFRKTKMLTGLSVIDLIRNVRLKKAEMLLRQRKLSISEIAFTVGFSDPKYFSKSFRHQYGKPPSQYVEESD